MLYTYKEVPHKTQLHIVSNVLILHDLVSRTENAQQRLREMSSVLKSCCWIRVT